MAAKDGGKADVFIDGELQTTVNSYFGDCGLPYLIAFMKTGLEPTRVHTIKIVVRGEKDARSSGA